MTQRPELIVASSRSNGHVALPYILAGAGWAYDYGTAQDSEEMFEYIKGYLCTQCKSGTHYPATMVTTGDHDDSSACA
jgi:prolyl oligopeptidase